MPPTGKVLRYIETIVLTCLALDLTYLSDSLAMRGLKRISRYISMLPGRDRGNNSPSATLDVYGRRGKRLGSQHLCPCPQQHASKDPCTKTVIIFEKKELNISLPTPIKFVRKQHQHVTGKYGQCSCHPQSTPVPFPLHQSPFGPESLGLIPHFA